MSSSGDQAELKQLNTRKTQAEARLKSIREELNAVRKRVNDEEGLLANINRSIQDLKAKAVRRDAPIIVSEHAMLRYLERVVGMDLDELRLKILPQTAQLQARALGNGSFPAGTHWVKVQNNVVVTVTTKDSKKRKKSR